MTTNITDQQDGFAISGAWMNIRTGETIQVRDNFIDGDMMLVRTMDGQLIPMDKFSNNYVQSQEVDEDIAKQAIKPVQTVPQSYGDIRPDFGTPVKHISNNNTEYKQPQQSVKDTPTKVEIVTEDNENKMLKKVFEKVSTKPTINLTFDWNEYPKKEMDMLIEYFDITKEDIVDYLYEKYFNKEVIKELIIKSDVL